MSDKDSRTRGPASGSVLTKPAALRRRSVLKGGGALALTPLVAVAGCGGSDDAGTDNSSDATPSLQTTFIADGVAHGYNYTLQNSFDPVFGPLVGDSLHAAHVALQPDDAAWKLSKQQFVLATDPGLVGSALFKESPNDFAVYHEVPFFGFFRDGSSSIVVGKGMRQLYGSERVALYGGVSPLQPDAMSKMDELAQTAGVVGLKLYPGDVINTRFQPSFMSDDSTLAIIERASKMGLKSIAVHKAFSLSQGPFNHPTAFNVGDVSVAAKLFPHLPFEIVHGGQAFLPETVAVLKECANVYVNLEGPTLRLIKQPQAFAQILAAFLTVDPKAERLIWATGCMLVHPRPFLEAFWAFQFPQAMLDGGTPALTVEMKQRILGGNLARILGISSAQQAKLIAAKARTYAKPWSGGGAAA